MSSVPIRVLVAGCGHMGASHARAYHELPAFAIAGLVSRGQESRGRLNAALGGGYPEFDDYYDALSTSRPDAVCISTYTETHAPYALAALEAGAHVFLEKPVADTADDAARVIDAARRAKRALVAGYILHVHPTWQRFIALARTLGTPLVMRMNLNQQSDGAHWATHRNLLAATSPIVDCGVHYVDVMCRMTGARPVRVSGIGARLADDIAANRFNYGHLQVTFDDGSVGWYEAGWGPMMSETAFFVKDVIGPRGSVSISSPAGGSADHDSHTRTDALRLHHAELAADGTFARADEILTLEDEPGHDALCRREQERFLDAIHGRVDLEEHWRSAFDSLRIVLAAEQSAQEGRTIEL
ncbi:MAG: Gfo/Idh/MocA family oxidoreductase [Acidobacteria bacterium]|nr:Gfo/Idh/MocA family oxidoreductase [Acidobacteriota bacterium]